MPSVRHLRLAFLLFAWLPLLRAQEVTAPATTRAGIEYFREVFRDVPWSIHVAKLDRRVKFRAYAPLAEDRIYGLAPLTKLIATLPAGLGEPVVAINGDFYQLEDGPYQGDPCGLQIVAGELVSAPNGPSFWFDPQGRPQIGPVRSRLAVQFAGAQPLAVGLNEARADAGAVLFTPRCGDTTHTKGGTELVLAPVDPQAWLPLQVERTYRARVEAVKTGGDAAIPPGRMVLSLGPQQAVPAAVPGAELALSTALDVDLRGVTAAVGGGPLLVRDGVVATFDPQGPRHPRTAIGFNDTHLLLVVVDGRQKGLSVGMTFHELAALMRRHGCTEALNLDGGGSSTFWLEGSVRNSPSGKAERPLGNALIFLAPPAKP